jgi:hypothetical protein
VLLALRDIRGAVYVESSPPARLLAFRFEKGKGSLDESDPFNSMNYSLTEPTNPTAPTRERINPKGQYRGFYHESPKF